MNEELHLKEMTRVLIEVFDLLNSRNYDDGEVKGMLLYVLLRVSNFKNLSISVQKCGDFLKNGAFRDCWLTLAYQVYWLYNACDDRLVEAIRESDLDMAVEEVRSKIIFDDTVLSIKDKQQIILERMKNEIHSLFFCLPTDLKQKVLDKAFYVHTL